MNPSPSSSDSESSPPATLAEWGEAALLIGPRELASIYEAGAALSHSLDLEGTELAIVRAAQRHFGFDRAGLWLFEANDETLRGSFGTDMVLTLTNEHHRTLQLSDLPAPIRAVATGELPFYLTDDFQRDRLPHAPDPLMDRVRHNAVVPLRRDAKTLGFLSVDNAVTGRPITRAHVRLLLLFANYAAAALHNARVAETTREHAAEDEVRHRLEDKIQRLRQVHAIAAEITSLDLQAVLRLVRDRLVEVFGFDRAGTLLYDPREPELLRGSWGTDWQGQPLDESKLRLLISEDAALSDLISGERPWLLRHWALEDRPTREPGAPQHVLVPLRSSRRLLGVLSVDNAISGRALTEDDLEILLLMAGHVSLAVQKASLFALEQEVNLRLRKVLRRESHIANTLQKAFKPVVPARMSGARLAHLYRPALAEADLGGDFYDVLDLGEGKLGLIMADVSGKGLAAAARTARARYALQAFASENLPTGMILQRLNDFLYGQADDLESYVTVFYGVFDTRTGEITCSSAGHEPPLLLRKGEPPVLARLIGYPCGLFPQVNYLETQFRLHPGDRLLLYSDGITEARREGRMLDLEGLMEAVREEAHRPLDSLVRRIYARTLRYSGGVMRDDVALLLVEYDPVPNTPAPGLT